MDNPRLPRSDSEFLAYLRGLAIFIIVFGHVGGFWIFRPYSKFLLVFIPVFFFISGAVSYYSYKRSLTISKYYKRRFVGLLVPYYLLCILALLYFIATHHTIPSFDIDNLLKWIQIRPTEDIMPFPIGQVWFLHTLFIITVFSPLYFILCEKSVMFSSFILLGILLFSSLPLFFSMEQCCFVFGNDMYKPIVYSSFYIFGILVFGPNSIFKRNYVLLVTCLGGIIVSILVVWALNLKVDYSFHRSRPDLYFLAGGFAAISLLVLLKELFLNSIGHIVVLKSLLMFFFKHTFSIYLIHTFGILIAEKLFWFIMPSDKTVIYGLVKVLIVLIISSLLAVPYTKISKAISNFLLA